MPLIFIGSLQLGWAAKSSQISQTCLSWLAQMVCGKTSQTCFSCLGLHGSTPPPLSFPSHIPLSLSLSLPPFLHPSFPSRSLDISVSCTCISICTFILHLCTYWYYIHISNIILLHIRQVFVHYIHILTYIHIR